MADDIPASDMALIAEAIAAGRVRQIPMGVRGEDKPQRALPGDMLKGYRVSFAAVLARRTARMDRRRERARQYADAGKPPSEIAEALGVSLRTANRYLEDWT